MKRFACLQPWRQQPLAWLSWRRLRLLFPSCAARAPERARQSTRFKCDACACGEITSLTFARSSSVIVAALGWGASAIVALWGCVVGVGGGGGGGLHGNSTCRLRCLLSACCGCGSGRGRCVGGGARRERLPERRWSEGDEQSVTATEVVVVVCRSRWCWAC
jgi:hypothetical protein